MLFQRLSLFFALAAFAVLMSVQARPLPEKSAIVRQDTYLVKRSNENAEVDDSDPDGQDFVSSLSHGSHARLRLLTGEPLTDYRLGKDVAVLLVKVKPFTLLVFLKMGLSIAAKTMELIANIGCGDGFPFLPFAHHAVKISKPSLSALFYDGEARVFSLSPNAVLAASNVGFLVTMEVIARIRDLRLNYNIVVSVFPFRLEELRYHEISSLVGWLLFIYLLLMEAPTFWVMCLGRLFEGISTAAILIAGLALICDATPEKDIGGQLGVAMIGVPLGSLVGPPVGGALYARWGYRAPFIFAILFTIFDFTARLLVKDNFEGSHKQEKQVAGQADSEAGKESAATANENSAFVPTDVLATEGPKIELSMVGVVVRLLTSVRALVALIIVFFCSVAFAALDVTIPLRLQAIWGYNSTKVGLVYLAAIIPTIISNASAGVLSDRFGPSLVAVVLLVAGIPWWGLLTLKFSVAFFIVSFAIESKMVAFVMLIYAELFCVDLFIAAVASPLTAELAAITRKIDGVGYAHTYGTFNIVFGVANAVGSVMGGQIYSHSPIGWDILCYINIGILSLCLFLTLAFVGERPLLHAWRRREKDNASLGDTSDPEKNTEPASLSDKTKDVAVVDEVLLHSYTLHALRLRHSQQVKHLPVNPEGESIRLTKDQLYQGLLVKAREPSRFVSAISTCKVLRENTTGLLREVQFKGHPAPVHEDVTYYPPAQLTFMMTDPATGAHRAQITNLISTMPTTRGPELVLTFAFAWGPVGELDTGADADALEHERREMAEEAIAHTLNVIREMVKNQEIQ
ncbi:hypothetical protein POSPLADRAFT_1046397 [Postia placenta MAD-698-R-SB12]|uniref:Major facilitator superfamily (MFS) profile domain-containing protein n=1 Tax=Postia placenta MAD-698-R-SB12 TaxID=670580 RepID=A0A1X6N3P7_9APHY|nr:hypothetical protein POSPLADRAFT_1046397 [Postia placenta MAD-698-R-SB12]OSX63063.1 hypothetical protein POSPLADRAFT_1046397 [Postia placenta MAD-698-R-SB12]